MGEKQEVKLIHLNLKKSFLLGLIFNFITGIFVGFFVFFLTILSKDSMGLVNIPPVGLVVMSFVLVPILTALFGGITFFIFAAISNLILNMIDGFNFSVEDVEVAPIPAPIVK